MSDDHWRVKLDLPAETRHLHIIRLTVAGAAAEAGLDVEEVEDVKIAVDELCSVAVAAATRGALLSIEFVAINDGLQVEATLSTPATIELDELGQAILDATVDAFTCDDRDPGGFHLIKNRRGR